MDRITKEMLRLARYNGSDVKLHSSQTAVDYHTIHRSAKVSLIIPTLNEANNLPLIFPFLPMDWIDEVILVDGRSTDNTVEIAKKLLPSIKIIFEMNPGKGAAMRAGYEAATGDILVVMDADGSNDPREIPRFVKALLEGADLVKGSRFAPGGGTTDMPLIRRMGNGAFVLISNLLFGTKFTDLCYGYHAFWKYCLAWLNIDNMNGFEIDACLYLQAVRQKLKVVEVFSFEGYRFYGFGKLQTIPDGWRVLKTILREYFVGVREPQIDLPIGFRGNMPALDNLLRRSLRHTLQETDATSGSILILDSNGEVNEACLAYGNDIWLLSSQDIANVVQQGLAGWVLQNREAVLVPCTRDDPRWLQRSWEKDDDCSRSVLATPLIVDGQMVGVLTLTRSHVKEFTEADLLKLQAV
jgi:glycosyltransferase involved in cell wall biosynthesis